MKCIVSKNDSPTEDMVFNGIRAISIESRPGLEGELCLFTSFNKVDGFTRIPADEWDVIVTRKEQD